MTTWKVLKPEMLLALQDLTDRIRRKKAELDKIRPLPKSVLDRLRHDFYIEWTHHTNAIEGNTLSLNETRVVLEEGLTIGGKTIREHLETISHRKAIEYIETLVHPNYALDIRDILRVHEIVLKPIDEIIAGRIRSGNVRISGANFLPPNAAKVPALLDELAEVMVSMPEDVHPVISAALFHHRFVWIHPFFDGNGRVARLFMNLLLMSRGYPPAIILRQDRKKYYEGLNAANQGDYTRFFRLILQAAERTLNIYLSAGDPAVEYVPIGSIVSEDQVPYNADYIGQLARKGKIDAYKEGKEWYTTSAAIKAYMQKRKRNRKPRTSRSEQ